MTFSWKTGQETQSIRFTVGETLAGRSANSEPRSVPGDIWEKTSLSQGEFQCYQGMTSRAEWGASWQGNFERCQRQLCSSDCPSPRCSLSTLRLEGCHFKRFFPCGLFLKFLLDLLQYCFCFMLWFLTARHGILASHPGIEHSAPRWKANSQGCCFRGLFPELRGKARLFLMPSL